jgi:hypothetical protein
LHDYDIAVRFDTMRDDGVEVRDSVGVCGGAVGCRDSACGDNDGQGPGKYERGMVFRQRVDERGA